ncbi:MAG: hypothetical protein ACI9MC_000928 [Kiritimatiellia bacterium]|jgi:hypothetical protein
MRAVVLALFPLLLLGGCSDYNLWGPEDPNRPDNDSDEPAPVEGPQPDIKVEPAELSFGSKLVDCPADKKTVTVTNIGDMRLNVSDLKLAGQGATAFSIHGGPQDLEPGQSFTFDVGFTAAGYQEYDVDVEVISNDPDSPVAGPIATGRGAENAMNEDSFVQPDVDAVDVLWVVDNSCSMSGIVEHLGDRFETFLKSFNDMDIDYQIGVTSTDMDNPAHQGRLLGPTKVISRDSGDPIGLFVQATDLGSSGSGAEKGLDAAYAALTAPLVNNENAGLIRDDAVLAVVVISDENDSSSISEAKFIDLINNYKGDTSKTSFSAVVGDKGNGLFGGCSSSSWPPVTAESGTRYITAQEATNGTFQSICDSDFDEVLSYLAFGASGLKFEFLLSGHPTSIGGIKVTVDGVNIPRHAVRGFFYNTQKNTIKFSRQSVPGPNAVVLVTYPVQGDCD